MSMIFDHVDLRVSDVGRARTFYDAFLRPFGFRGRPQDDGTLLYFRLEKRHVREAIAVIPDPQHRPNLTRLAFCAPSRADVDRIGAIAAEAGARAYEAPALCDEIAENYYAAFFEDPDGNRLEVVCR
jgi:catechol 2,3-dioxygenase-like lactoylglutathione lyase family enzyme